MSVTPNTAGNQKIKYGIIAVVAIIAVLIIYQIFSSVIRFPLEGKWYMGEGSGTYSLNHTWSFKDGSFQDIQGTNSKTGTYEVVDRGDEGKIEITSNNQVKTYDYVVKDDIATLTVNGQGSIIELKKAPN